MQNLLRFLRMYNVLIIFLLLQGYSINLYLKNNTFQNNILIEKTSNYTGKIYDFSNYINEYFNLKNINNQLMIENSKLHNLKSKNKINYLSDEKYFNYLSAKVINNSIFKRNNYLTINKGKKHGVEDGMGVISTNGVIGIVHSTSENYALIISILNKQSAISICLKKQNNYGSLKWRGFNYKEANVESIPNHVQISSGDTIITNGYSTIFPSEINIGTVKSSKKNNKTGNQDIIIDLFTDFNNINCVYVVKSQNSQEQLKLESFNND